MLAIFKREFKSYFHTVIGFLFVAVLTFFLGLYFLLINALSGYPYVGVIFASVIFIFMFAFPILTMRSMAEDQKTKTDQLLLTSPASVTGMVMGKFLAMAAVYAIPCLLAATLPLITLLRTNHYPVSDLLGLVMFFLVGCVYIAIGQFLSSLTESQVIAAILTILTFVVVYLCASISSYVPDTAVASLVGFAIILIAVCVIYFVQSRNLIVTGGILLIGAVVLGVLYGVKSDLLAGKINTVLDAINLTEPITKIADYHVFDLKGVVYYVSLIAFFCFLTIQSVQKKRWS